MVRTAVRSSLPLVACLLAAPAGADPIGLEDLIGERGLPRVESFEELVAIEFPDGVGGVAFGVPPTGFEFRSGVVLRSPDPNDAAGLLIGDFGLESPSPVYDLGSNGFIDSFLDVLLLLAGTAYAATGSEAAGEILFEFPVPVDAFGFFVSSRDAEPLTLRSYDARGELIEQFEVASTAAAPLIDFDNLNGRPQNFVGLSSEDRPISFFSVEGGEYAFDHLLFEETLGCSATPQPFCKTSLVEGSKLKIKGGKLVWKLKNGADTEALEFGTLRQSGGVSICLYDTSAGEPRLAAQARVPADETLWSGSGSGFKYKDKEGRHDGIVKIKLKASDDSSTRIVVKGEDMDLPATPLDEDPSVRIQLSLLGGGCFETEFRAPAKKNDAKVYKAVEE